MAIKEVIRMGHPTLREIAAPFTEAEILSSETKALIQDLTKVRVAHHYFKRGFIKVAYNLIKDIVCENDTVQAFAALLSGLCQFAFGNI